MPPKLNKFDRAHLSNLAGYQRQIDRLYRELLKEASLIGAAVGKLQGDSLFSFADYPTIRKRAERLLAAMQSGMYGVIVNGVNSEWTLANNKNNELARQVFGDNIGKLTHAQYRRYFSTNGAARDAFITRKEAGLNLSDRVWRYTNQFKTEIELGLDVGIRNGMSAPEMARELKSWLREPDKLFRRVHDERGELQLSQAAKAYHSGQGVYRSSYKNALRLAATETNMAYRTADYERWQQMDFIVGIKIEPSKTNHPVPDICDDLAGLYPKDFKWTGWHPHCRCHALSVLKTDKEIEEDTRRLLNGEEPAQGSVNKVYDVPDTFNKWIDDNKERAKGWSNMPYFVRSNPQYVSGFEVDTYSPAERMFTRARSTSPAMEESLGIFLQARYPDIPNTEKAAIFHFTRGDISAYRQLNNQLRKGNLSEFNQAFSELLSSGLSKIEPVEQTVYRTLRLNRTILRSYAEMAMKGNVTTFVGFTSATTQVAVAKDRIKNLSTIKKNETDVLFVIKSKTGHPIEDLSQFSGRIKGLPNQHEVLFDKGRKFRFEKVVFESGKMPVFYLTEV